MIRKFSLAFITAILLVTLSLSSEEARAQNDFGQIMRAGASDANLLLESYLKPFGAGFGSNMNTGWINSARPYEPLGFDLRVSAAVAFVPSSDQMFDVTSLGLSTIEVVDGGPITPTAFGDDVVGPTLGSIEMIDGERLFEFEMPQGSGFPYVPSPMIQLTLGVPLNSDVSLRFIPTTTLEDDVEISLWGFGVKHLVNQWLPGGDALPFDLSVMFGYSDLKTSVQFDVQPEPDSDTYVPEGYEAGASRWENQGAELKSKTFTSNILAGKNFRVLSLFAGVGYQNSMMDISTPGSYPIIELNSDENGDVDPDQPKRIDSIEDPVSIDISGGSGFRALAGFRFRLSILTISGTYTLAKYPVANVGVGLSLN